MNHQPKPVPVLASTSSYVKHPPKQGGEGGNAPQKRTYQLDPFGVPTKGAALFTEIHLFSEKEGL